MPIKGFLHAKLDVADLDRSIEFYCSRLGLEQLVRYDRDDGVTIVQVVAPGSTSGVELWWEPPHKSFAQDRLHLAFQVSRLDTVLAAVGAEYLDRAPFEMGHERIAFIRDPDGYLIELNEFEVVE
jgi:lactoylglutathione lyase